MGMGNVKLTKDYVGGIIVGIGMGLVACQLLIRQFSVDPTRLLWPGVLLSVGGAFFVLVTQKLAAAKEFDL